MYKTKLCLGLGDYGISDEEQIEMIKKAGFDGFFTSWNFNIKKYRELADKLGMIYQSVHAPFDKAAILWKEDEDADKAVDEIIKCIDDCAESKVPIMVMHTYIGFEPNDGPTQAGLINYGKIVNHAKSKNIKVAFENTEGENYLAALMNKFKNYDNVGFCLDTGHEQCYNYGKDLLALYGDKLICTHINDNLGISDYNGKIFWTDDLHLLPFDGIVDWNNFAERLCKCGYNDILTFELNIRNKPNRHELDKYSSMTIESYIAEAYTRACRVAVLKQKYEKN